MDYVATHEDVDRWMDASLHDLGLTREELDAQAEAGVFSSHAARRLWMALPWPPPCAPCGVSTTRGRPAVPRSHTVCADCPDLAPPGDSYCPTHRAHRRATADARRPSASQRGYGHAWAKRAARYRKDRRDRGQWTCEHPNCEKPGEHVDHIVAQRPTGKERDDELQELCKPHHSAKTASHDTPRDEHGRWQRKDHEAKPKRRGATTLGLG